jgi:hypothetical protein
MLEDFKQPSAFKDVPTISLPTSFPAEMKPEDGPYETVGDRKIGFTVCASADEFLGEIPCDLGWFPASRENVAKQRCDFGNKIYVGAYSLGRQSMTAENAKLVLEINRLKEENYKNDPLNSYERESKIKWMEDANSGFKAELAEKDAEIKSLQADLASWMDKCDKETIGEKDAEIKRLRGKLISAASAEKERE